MANAFMIAVALRTLVAAALVVTAATVLVPTASRAGAATPPPGLSPVVQRAPNGVTADALPTVQINGVVWSQAVVGNTVYAGGSFTNARPAGAAPGTNLTSRANLLAFSITTGALNTTFAPSLNAQVKTVVASPDGSRIYVGGDFTTANGQPRSRIAAYSTATGQLIASFAPTVDAAVNAIVATNTVVYVGGGFTRANNTPRAHLAAFSATNGALLTWAPSADNNAVNAMVMAPGGSRVVIGGSFTSINGSPSAYGLGAVDPSTGALLPWAVSSVVKDAGTTAAILSLSTDGTNVYGSGYDFGPGGNFEGAFAADPTGNIVWIEDCHGDTYSVFGVNGAVYTVSHAHFCGNVGGYPQNLGPWIRKHAVAFTAAVTGTVLRNTQGGYQNFGGKPSPSVIDWFPDMAVGTYTGQSQAAWDVSGNSQYVVLGGEFPTVDGTPQQGLVRFGVPSVTTPNQGPRLGGAGFTPTLRPVSSTAVRVSWPANWDRDDQTLTYTVVRDGNAGHPIYTGTGTSQWWNRPIMGTVDTGLTPGSTHSYYVTAADPNGHKVRGNTLTITVPTSSPSKYAQQIPTDNAAAYYRFDDPSGSTTARDASGGVDLSEGSGVTEGSAGAIIGDADTAASFNGSSSGTAWTPSQVTAPNTYSLEAWFTTTAAGGKIIGFGDSQQGSSSQTDRQIYLNSRGQVTYGVYNGSNTVLTTPGSYNDGAWHQVVATLSSAGMVLYVDGAKVASNAAVTNGRPVSGYWRVGGDSLGGWPSAPGNPYFAGALDEVAIYPYALSLTAVQNHYVLSGRTPAGGTLPPTATFTSLCTHLACSFDGSSSQPSPGATLNSYAWTFGDGKAGTGATPSHTFAAAGSYDVTLTVADSSGRTAPVTKPVSVTAAPRTTIVHVLPTDGRHRLESGWAIARRVSGGSCRSGRSQHVPGADRCFANHNTYDPCWPVLTAAGRYRGGYCPGRPWSHRGVLVTGHRSEPTHTSGHRAWGLQTASGVRCYSLSGSVGTYRGKAVDWACADNKYALLARLNTRQPQWRIVMVDVDGQSRYSAPRTVAISRAWVGVSPYGA